MHRRLAAATALGATLLLGACTPDAPQPPPPPSSGPPEPSASSSPTHASPSPTTSQHEDLLEAQRLYRAEFRDEIQVIQDGGATALPPAIRNRTTGIYRSDLLRDFRSQKMSGDRQIVSGKLVGIAAGRWTSSKVTIKSCEDYSKVRSVDRHGKPIDRAPGPKVVQTVTFVKHHDVWLISAADPAVVQDFHGTPCNRKWIS